MLVASILSGITDSLTSVVGDYGFYAVFLLMAIDAVFPAASEAVMVYGGAVASGAFAGQSVVLLGWTLEPGFPRTSRSPSPARSATRSDRSAAGGSECTGAVRSSSATAAGST